TAGNSLMVVENTGIDFINGHFADLAHGQELWMTFDGSSYKFVANYFGGNGNDLVLEWAEIRAMSWGSNGTGQLGTIDSFDSPVPVNVMESPALTGKTILALAGGGHHSLALCSDGTVIAWGYREVGNGSFSPRGSPMPVDAKGVLQG